MKYTPILIAAIILQTRPFLGQTKPNNLAGKYIGYEIGQTERPIKKNGKYGKEIKTYSPKTLQLNNDSTFSFEYFWVAFFSSQGGKTKTCTGKWSFKNDTLYLTSKFKTSDFYSVRESFQPTSENKLIKIAVISPKDSVTSDSWFTRVKISVDDKEAGLCNLNDTLYCKADIKKEIYLRNDYTSGDEMKWTYKPRNSKSNYFAFQLKRSHQGENMYFENIKLVLKDDELVPVGYGWSYLSVDENRYYKKVK